MAISESQILVNDPILESQPLKFHMGAHVLIISNSDTFQL